MTREDIEAVVRAMGAIALIREHYASGEAAWKLTEEILWTLRGDKKSLFRVNMANAIGATLLNRPIEDWRQP